MTGKQVRRTYVGIAFIALFFVGTLTLLGLVPFPGDFMRAWYEPWRTETVINGVPTIPHKAVGHDVFRQIYPFKFLSIDVLTQGSLPLWNPYNGSGQPLLAVGIQTIFNPVMGIFFFLDPPTAWTVLYVGQFVVLACAYMVFVSGLGISLAAAGISCVFLLGSSFIVANSLFATFVYSFAGLPWLLWCIDQIHQKKLRGWQHLPLAVAWTILTGFPQLTMYIFLAVGAYALFRLRAIRSWRFWATFVFHTGIGIGISAIQLIPQYELYRESAIDTSSSAFIFQTFLMPVLHTVSLIIPNFFGNPATYNYWGYADYVETAISVGSIAVCLAMIGIMAHEKKQRAVVLFFIALGIGAWIVAVRSPLTQWLYRLPIPVLTTGVPTRSLGVVTFAFCVLAAFGLDIFLGKIKEKRIYIPLGVVWGTLGVILIGVYVFGRLEMPCNNPVITSCFSVAFRNSLLEIGIFTLFGGMVILSRIFRRFVGRNIFVVGLCVVVLSSAVYNAYKFIPFTNVRTFMPEHPLLTQLRNLAPDRVAYRGVSMPTDVATQYRFYDTNYYAPLYIRRYGELVSYVNTGNSEGEVKRSDVEVVSDATVSAELSFRRDRFWDMTGSRMLVTKQVDSLQHTENAIWENAYWQVGVRQTALPRAYLVRNVEVFKDPDAELAAMFSPETDMSQTAFVDEAVVLSSEKKSNHDRVHIDSYESDRVSLSVESVQDAFLVLSDTYYPGWRASVDGSDVPIYRTNYTFRGVVVPGGKHTVLFYYQPDSWRAGYGIAIVSLLVWIAVCCYNRSLKGALAKW